MARKSSANLNIKLGDWTTKVKLYRVEAGAETPEVLITHTCRGEVSIVDKCAQCGYVTRITGAQKSGHARGKAATEPKDIHCPACQSTKPQEEATFCGACEKPVPEAELEHRLAMGGRTLPVDKPVLDAWRALIPPAGEMRIAAVVLRNTLGSYFFDQAYQVVPDKGSVLGFAAWMRYLAEKRAALIAHFQVQENFKIGALYVASVRGTPVMILHTLLGLDEIRLEPFEVPEVPEALGSDIHSLLAPQWTATLECAMEHPQRVAFGKLFAAAQDGGKLEIPMRSVLPGELAALSKQLSARLAPPKKKGKKEAQEPDDMQNDTQ